ncbi:MAG TPA: [FeFe] hydrogenase H-cluster radical SAM maturase HydE [Peptococcaceae bacterium]|nr:MAG: Iron-only hydrogenase maturation protein HydE [Moorella sp. 60_41]HBT47215.1 [FeFe] hydrogenase H-cluster radical SAM maturase HydE [Peptococcaceae bacterium]
MRREFIAALERVTADRGADKEDIVVLLTAQPGGEEEALYRQADALRVRYVGDEVHLRGVIEFSNYCRRRCRYCGLTADNHALPRYRMDPEEILAAARRGVDLGYKTIVLQSGEDPWYTGEVLAEIVACIKEWGVAVTLCVGERTREEYELWRRAGADRYLLKHETANPELYSRLHPGMSWDKRMACLRWLKELGYQVGSGNIVGLPGQTLEDLADDILLMRELEVEMAGIGPFIPHPHTTLRTHPAGSLDLTYRVLAVTRLVIPWAHLPATTAVGTLSPNGRQMALQRGANVVMPNLTPKKYRAAYQIYPGKICLEEAPEDCRRCLEGMIRGLGRIVATHPGHGLKGRRPCRRAAPAEG